jgi:CRISPR/Cas system CSM-associated protein Csm2 small subunit
MPETCFSYQKSADIEKLAQKQALLAMTKAWGMTEAQLKALFRKKPTTTDEEIEEMERIVAEQSKLREHIQTAAGGLSYQDRAAETFAEIITKALEKVVAKQEKKT